MNFKRTNNLVGWVICIIACFVYIKTMEATGSLWDCGEFISSAYKVQIPHPPGAPLFVLLGRLFTMFLSPSQAALGVNVMTALASGFTILFLFWTITHFARRIMVKPGEEISREKLTVIMGAGIVGALAYTFSDSFWFSAVEGEVYGMSSFFTAIVFWAILKWEHEADEPYADRWIVLIGYLLGLSIGVHLLNLLTIPAMVMVYYFRKYKATGWGTFWAFVIGCGITGIIQKYLIQDTVKASGYMDVFFVNSLGLGFFSGFIFYFALIVALLVIGYRKPKFGLYAPFIVIATIIVVPAFNDASGTVTFFKIVLAAFFVAIPYLLKTVGVKLEAGKTAHFSRLTISFVLFMLLGYSTYITTMVRSTANPSVDMYNVDNPISLVGYLGREQYGDFPLVYGQVFTATPTTWKEGANIYARGAKKYEISGKKMEPVYDPSDMMLFPRVWDASNDQGHAEFYRTWLGLQQGEKPSFVDNIKFFVSYQVNFMYFRYFLWNFAGKQNDTQGYGNVRDGNWISGIPFIDNFIYGDQSMMPDSLKDNKAHNTLFFLPFILGLMGFFFQYNKHRKDTLIVSLLFFFTGLAIVVYLNQAGNQPRERDYAYVGSFYAFAIWIGLGVLSVYNFLQKKIKGSFTPALATAICLLAVPVLMGFQEWDDHDRSTKYVARDVAKDYLESCQKNAILFTVGDNDTYPLWYAQEVEGIRPDVRVINLSLLGVDWYIDQMRKAVNESPAIEMSWSPDKYKGENRNYIRYFDPGNIPADRYFNLKEIMDFMGSDDPNNQASVGNGTENFLPTRQLYIPVNKEDVLKNGVVSPKDSARILSSVQFKITKNILFKNDLALLDIIATNNWKRPIYFTSPSDLGLNDYLQTDGLAYHLVPLPKATAPDPLGMDINANVPVMYDNLMHKFEFGGAQTPGTYFDEPNRKMIMYLRQAYTKLSIAMTQEGKSKDSALKVLNYMDKNVLEQNFPYAMTSPGNMHNYTSLQTIYAYYMAGDTKKADEIAAKVIKDCEQQLRYYSSLPANRMTSDLQRDGQNAQQFIAWLHQMKQDFGSGAKKNNNEGLIHVEDSGQHPADSGK
ncbi:Protein of unknown function [Chitinophaga terrae (ex Kim and Jung 2007)]|uniref:DUF2723 domain-containing protein n=1 Tax=Chitinophaga terrae (ex Kim and Jung 2007) TaxID=408074 RepID=A0A1H4GIR7_9BACT|nr:DUF2723 domain-containing protein [Chitinophaga terrae (ex Kim and Jung 2007)]GEP93502.1 membrane protein [Chitinophaga terrae (ex Kim and Jung 2007)]SEB09523.1 Protein of unknown function [Chitinophaga terrae (ex Kim and Jung 2007)]